MEKIERDESFDCDMVNAYLKDFPEPSVGTMQEVFKPEKWNFEWRDFLREPWDYKMKILRRCIPRGNVLLDGVPLLELTDWHGKYYGQPVELTGFRMLTISDVEPWVEWTTFTCINCGNVEAYRNDRAPSTARIKKKCCEDPCYVPVGAKDLARESIDSQWITIMEEHPDTSRSNEPVDLSALVKGEEMMWYAGPKDHIRLIGIMKARLVKNRMDGTSTYRKWFEVYGIRKLDPKDEVKVTDEDKQYIENEMNQPGFYDKLIRSYAPHLYGAELMKEFYLLAIASIGLPRPARFLIVGDPAIGKSELNKYTCELMRKAFLVQMGRATKTGLTASSEMNYDSGRRHVKPGLFVEADGGLLCIDELQLAREEDMMNLNDVIESGKVKYALPGGHNGSFDANPALILTCNPHSGRIADEKNIAELLKFMGRDLPQILSRMNATAVIRDNTTPEYDRKVAYHMLKHNDNLSEGWEDMYHDNWIDEETGEERFGRRWIRKIIHYVTNFVKVESMSSEEQKALVDYYVKNREDVVASVNKVIISMRFVRHALVLATFIARLNGRSKPSHEDVNRAMNFLETSLTVAALDPATQTMDMNVFEGNKSKGEIRKLDDQSEVREAIEKYMAEKDPDGNRVHKFFTVEGISEKLWYQDPIKWNDAETKVRRIIRTFLHTNMIYEKGALGSGEYGLS